MKVAVIGSGIAGIASAIRLQMKGHDVEVFEANEVPGGKIREHAENGFRFDMGPSVFTLPNLIDELFELAGKNPRDYFNYQKLEPAFRFFWEDGTQVDWEAGPVKLAQEIQNKTGEPAKNVLRFSKDVQQKWNITREVFIENSLHILSNYFTMPVLKGILQMYKVGVVRTMNQSNSHCFKDARVVQLFNHFASYVGSNPLVAPATMNVIAHLPMNVGVHIPKNGMYSLVKAMVRLAEEIGVRFQFNSKVDEILTEKNSVVGIKVRDEKFVFDRVVSNMDVHFTYHNLLPQSPKPIKTLDQPKSSSAIAFLWGMNTAFPNLSEHNMFFAKDSIEEYKQIFEEKTVANDPSVYVSIPSKHNLSDAPIGKENWFVLVTAPHLNNQDWPRLISQTRETVITKLERILATSLRDKIELEKVLSPTMIERDYFSAFGSIYGNSSNSRFAAFLRHPNFSKQIKGLYFAGGSVHPGAGIPMCLNSAKIVEKIFK